MDVSYSTDTIETKMGIPSLFTSVYNLTTNILSLIFLLCYEYPKIIFLLCYKYPKITFLAGIILVYIMLNTILDAIIRAVLTAPVRCLSLGYALILVSLAWHLHRLIKEHDEIAMRGAVRAAGLASAEQWRFLGGEEGGRRAQSEGNGDGKEGRDAGNTRGWQMSGGLDLDIWQGGGRLKRRGTLKNY